MIKRLRVKGFRRFVDSTFELERGVTFIDGRNNAGKTTLFLAIEYALTGTVAGARSQMMLLNPAAKGLGVELVFTGRDGKTYKLQRLHQLPPKARTKLVGHFTLKEIVGEDDERYLLSSDFQDHDDALAKKLQEITGISRRVLDLAVHVRQGDITKILDGDPRLDIALGITAAQTANEEMRSLALEDEQAIEALPALEASLDHVERERSASTTDETGLRDKLAKLQDELEKLDVQPAEESDDDELEAFSDAVDEWHDAGDRGARADEGLAELEPDVAQQEKERAATQAQLDVAAARGDEAERRAELRARIRRRTEQVERGAKGATTCEHCGAPLDSKRAQNELAEWKSELERLDASAIDVPALREKLRDLDRRVHALATAKSNVERARADLVRTEAAARALVKKGDRRSLDDILEERQAASEKAKLARAAAEARNEAKREALATQIEDIEGRLEQHARRGGDLDREHARLVESVERLRQRRRRSEDLRVLAAAFKTLQEDLRTRAASELSVRTFEIHKALSVDHEIVQVEIDPARYQMLVTPRDTGTAMPASLAQGGGHRLLLGLAFRLALLERLGPFPFMLLDEPTYGLDERHRHALLGRIATLSLCEQILVVTHQSMGEVPAQRIVLDREAA
ncbi:MAG: AAA family ATPase [Kofleriaceae bacterium]